MQAAAKPTRRVLISRHTCAPTQVGGREAVEVGGGTWCPASTLLRASLGMWGAVYLLHLLDHRREQQTGAYYFAQEPFAERMVSVLESAVLLGL